MECFYFYDCPRTGGTSVKRWSKSQNNLKRLHYGVKPWHHVPFKRPDIIDQDLRPRVYTGNISTLTFLRNPLEHTISLYAKIRNHKHAYASKFQKISFQEWINGDFAKDVETAPEPWGFSMVRFYDPETGNLEKAIYNIESINFVGFTERLNQDMNLFLESIGLLQNYCGNKLNPSQRNFEIDGTKDIIKEARAQDYQLVNYFRKKRGLQLYD
jgi:hypothetical protein